MPPANGAAVGRSRLAWRSPLLCRAGVHARRTVKSKKSPSAGSGACPAPPPVLLFQKLYKSYYVVKNARQGLVKFYSRVIILYVSTGAAGLIHNVVACAAFLAERTPHNKHYVTLWRAYPAASSPG